MLRKFTKFEYLGIINLVFAFLQARFLLGTIVTINHVPTLSSLIYGYFPDVYLLICVVTHLYLSYKLIWKRQYSKSKFSGYLLLTILALSWFIWIFIGFFFVTTIFYPVISLILIGGLYYLLQKYWKKIALLAASMSLLLVILTIAFNFQETYCYDKGVEIDPTGSAMVSIPADQARNVVGGMVSIPATGNATIGKAFYYHMLCHQNFDLGNALKEKYGI